MFQSLTLGRVFGIPVRLNMTFFLLPLWVLGSTLWMGLPTIVLTQAILWTVFVCVLLHEFGHALAARSFHIGTRDITLYPIGGVARLDSTGNKPSEEVIIALAGPAVNLAIALLLTPVVLAFFGSGMLGQEEPDALGLVGMYFGAVWLGNIILMTFNLLPAFPMDGGRVLRAVLSNWMARLKATEIAAAVGLGMAILLGLGAIWFGLWGLLLVAVFVGVAGQMELAALRAATAAQAMMDEDSPLDVVRPRARLGGFTGLMWDSRDRVWVRWENGRPVEEP